MKGKCCIIIAGGTLGDPAYHKKILAAGDYVICADGGARYAEKLGVRPDLLVGDFDTLSSAELRSWRQKGVKILQFSKVKDYTDTQLALRKALEMGFSKIRVIAALGGRLDHTWVNVMLLALPEVQDADVRILDENQEILALTGSVRLEGEIGEVISLIPLTQQVRGIQTTGLQYQVPQGILSLGMSMGISNVFAAPVAEIKLEEGRLLVIRNLKHG